MTSVYLSSTYEDLKEHRRAVSEALRQAGYQVVEMEDYVATDARPVERCLADVSEADIFVGIVAFRYGYVPLDARFNPNQLSVNELEFRHAKSLGKTCLLFLASDNAPWSPRFIDSVSGDDKGERIDRLRRDLQSQFLVQYFATPEELAQNVLAAVARLPGRPDAEGKVNSERSAAEAEQARQSGNLDPLIVEATGAVANEPSGVPDEMEGAKPFAIAARVWVERLASVARVGGYLALGATLVGASLFLAQRAFSDLSSAVLDRPSESRVCAGIPGMGPEMVILLGGTFDMGDMAGRGSSEERPVRTVNVRSFAMSVCEVTFDEYDAFAKATKRNLPDDAGWGRGRRPVINVSWEDTQAYVTWLSEQTGKLYRLPSEAEWEYAARSGGKIETWAGTETGQDLKNYAWYEANSGGTTKEVGRRRANGLGLHDMSGNVWEWIEDCWHSDYNGAPTDGKAWKDMNGGNCGQRVIRGGSWDESPVDLRSSFRGRISAEDRTSLIGFRLAQGLN